MKRIIIIFLIILSTFFGTRFLLDDPNIITKEQVYASETNTLANLTKNNYNGLDNFIFQFQNTIRGWVGKSFDDYNRNYASDNFAKKRWYILGKYLPYLIVFIFLINEISLFYKNKKE